MGVKTEENRGEEKIRVENMINRREHWRKRTEQR